VIWAIGQGEELSYHGSSTDNRGATIVHFYKEKKNNTLPPSTLSYSLLMPNATIPAQKTTYMVMKCIESSLIQFLSFLVQVI